MNDWSHWFRVDGRQNRVYNKNNMCALKNIGIPVDVPSSGATSRDFVARSLARSIQFNSILYFTLCKILTSVYVGRKIK